MLSSIVMARMMADSASRRMVAQRKPQQDGLIPAAAMPVAELALVMKQKHFLPDVSYSDLLATVSSNQSTLKKTVFNARLKSYNELYWFQKVLCEAPVEKDIKVSDIPFESLERHYKGKATQFELFDALCELREHRLITLDTTHPYRVGMTAKGRSVLNLLENHANTAPANGTAEELPTYADVVQFESAATS